MTPKIIASVSATAGVFVSPFLHAQQTPEPAATASRPNIVIILADDVGYSDIGCFGGEISTPNIDRIAKNGVAFTQFYNQARCCPTRAALLTGRYPHQVGVGEMIGDNFAQARANAASRAYSDHLSTDTPTIAEVLRTAGYRTLMSGKWHMGERPGEWPVRRGFDRSFVLPGGAMNYFGGNSGNGGRTRMAIDDKPWPPPHDGFYSTDAFAARAIEFLDETVQKTPGKPFFLYLSFNAAHFPLQAPEDEVAKYKGVYDAGWQPTREKRLARQKESGLVPADLQMAPMDTGPVRPWNKLSSAERTEWARRMEVYAAQVTRMDTNIGRVLDALDRLGVAENTLVLFFSDNGGAAEDPNGGDKTLPIGHRDTNRGYARPWATVSNTPWKRHKVTSYEGGISTPLLVRWPAAIAPSKNGSYVREPAHVLDLFPSFMTLAAANYPETDTVKLEGHDITPMLKGGRGSTDRTYCWEHQGYRAIRDGKWKLVSAPPGPNRRNINGPWELYDEENDRVESRDLASQNPGIVQNLIDKYNAWAERCGVIDFTKIAPEGRGQPAVGNKGKGGKSNTTAGQ